MLERFSINVCVLNTGQVHVPTPRVPTSIPKTSASRAFWTTAYRRMRSLFVREDSRRAVSTSG